MEGILGLHPSKEPVILRFIVVQIHFDPDKAVGHEQHRVLGIEGNPAQIGKPDLDPGVPSLANLESQDPFRPIDVEGLIEGDTIDDEDGNADTAQEGRTQMGIVLAIALPRLEAIEGGVT